MLCIGMKQISVTLLIAIFVTNCIAWSSNNDRRVNMLPNELLDKIYRTMLLKSKRSPSMGLSLAEYMASPQGQDNFHFIPSGRR